MKILIILLLIPQIAFSELHSTESWVARYISPCPNTPGNRVCFDKTKRNFKRMLKYKKMIFKYLDEYNLPGWLGTIPFIESEYTTKAISKSGAIGLWQIMPSNLIHYMTKVRGPINGYYFITKPTREKAIKKGYDPEENTEIACKMLKHLYEKYGKNDEKIVQAYNAGEFRIDCQSPKTKSLALRCASRGILRKQLTTETLNYYHQLMSLQMLLDDITSNNIYRLR